MSAPVLKQYYLHAIGGYIEVVEPVLPKTPYKVRFNWDLAGTDDPSMQMNIAHYKNRVEADKLYNKVALGDTEAQAHLVDWYYERFSSKNPLKDARFKYYQRSLMKEFAKRALDLDVQDPQKNLTYDFDDVIDSALADETDISPPRAEAQKYVEAISADYGVVTPRLYWGKKGVNQAIKDGVTTRREMKGSYGLQVSSPPSVIIQDAHLGTLLHEMAHHVSMCAATPDVHTAHGELFNRVYLQILQRHSDIDTEMMFDSAQAIGLFRPEVRYEDVMNPIGMNSYMPIWDAPEAELP